MKHPVKFFRNFSESSDILENVQKRGESGESPSEVLSLVSQI